MKQEFDLENWNRKEHFEFFNQFEEPFFGLVTQVNCSNAYQFCKKNNLSFFVFYLHKVMKAVNTIENFRYRINEGKIYIYDQIDASATITREDGTFGFSLIKYNENFEQFNKNAKQEIERIQTTKGIFTRKFEVDNLIHFSAIPWVDFTNLSHARSFTFPDSCPKISVGKLIKDHNTCKFSVSVHAHHGLMDGIHVGQFFEKLEDLLQNDF